MTILHLLDPAGGGARLFGKERSVVALAAAQRAAGTDARIATFRPSPLAEHARAAGVPYDSCRDGGLVGLVDRNRADVLHAHGYKANILSRQLRLQRPAVVLVATCHGFVDGTAQLRRNNAVDRWTAWLSDVVTVTAPAMSRAFPPFVRTVFVPNAIDDAPAIDAERRRTARARFGFASDALVVGTIGRLSPEKGLATFAAVAERLPRLHFVAAGEGPEAAFLRTTAVAALGFVEPADDLLAALDVFVQPSYTEGLSLALLEAMRGAVPIAATRVGATANALAHEREALLVAPHDVDGLAAAIDRLAGDADEARRLGLAARARFEAAFRLPRQAATFAALYAGARADRKRPQADS